MSNLNDMTQLNQLITDTDESVAQYERIQAGIVSTYTTYLDALMQRVYTEIVSVDNPSIDILEKYFMELTNAIYFAFDKTEKVGIYDDISKSQMKETYNKAYLDSQNPANGVKNTVASSTAIAESAAAMNTILNSIYNRSYKVIRNKIDSAQDMVKVLSKLISRRMTEMQMTQQSFSNSVEQPEEDNLYNEGV